MALIIFIITILAMMSSLIWFPKVKIYKFYLNTHWLIISTGAILMLFFGQINLYTLLNALWNESSMNPIKLIILFIFMTIISLFLDEVGFFKWLAYQLIDRVKGSQIRIFITVYTLTTVLTVFTSNDVIILTLTPLIIYFTKNVKLSPLPYLFGILTAANTWSLMLMIGNPTNIYIASQQNIDFMQYLQVMWLPALVAGFSGFILIYVIFRKKLSQQMEPVVGAVILKHPWLMVIGLIHLLLCIVLLALSNLIVLEMWLITLIIGLMVTLAGFIYLRAFKESISPIIKTYQRAPWSFIPMIISMFILVRGLSDGGYTDQIGLFLQQFDPVWAYGFGSHIASNVMNNQPMSMLFAEILSSQPESTRLVASYAAIIGSNTGVLLTPFGALAGLMWFELLKRYGIELTVWKYIKTMFLVGTIIILLTLLALILVI